MNTKLLAFFFILSGLCQAQTNSSVVNDKSLDPKITFLASIGPSFRVGKIPSGLSGEEKNYIKDLKSGMDYDLSLYYQLKSNNGIGIKYNAFMSKGSNYSPIFGYYGDDITITYIGPSFIIHEDQAAKVGEASMEFSLGYIQYVNDSYIYNNDNYKFKGSNLGVSTSFSYHFRLSKNILVGPQFAFVGGVLGKMDLTHPDGRTETIRLKDEEKESLYRIDLNISAKIRI